jgi:hypothetical protein
MSKPLGGNRHRRSLVAELVADGDGGFDADFAGLDGGVFGAHGHGALHHHGADDVEAAFGNFDEVVELEAGCVCDRLGFVTRVGDGLAEGVLAVGGVVLQ